jgi:hypothetical protein
MGHLTNEVLSPCTNSRVFVGSERPTITPFDASAFRFGYLRWVPDKCCMMFLHKRGEVDRLKNHLAPTTPDVLRVETALLATKQQTPNR